VNNPGRASTPRRGRPPHRLTLENPPGLCARETWREEDDELTDQATSKAQWDPAGGNPARPRQAASRKRVLRGVEQSNPRSVDSESVGRVMEPRNWILLVRADAVILAEGTTYPRERLREGRPPRGQRAGHADEGPPGTWEARTSPREDPAGDRSPSPGPPPPASSVADGNEEAARREVGPSEGNEARHEGRAGVGADHTTEEASERQPGGAGGGKGQPGGRDQRRARWPSP